MSVYALTDQPVIRSGDSIGFLDPTGKYAAKDIMGDLKGRKYKLRSQTFVHYPKQLEIFDFPDQCGMPTGKSSKVPQTADQ